MIVALTATAVGVCLAAAWTAESAGLFVAFFLAAGLVIGLGLLARDDYGRHEGDGWFRKEYQRLSWEQREKRGGTDRFVAARDEAVGS